MMSRDQGIKDGRIKRRLFKAGLFKVGLFKVGLFKAESFKTGLFKTERCKAELLKTRCMRGGRLIGSIVLVGCLSSRALAEPLPALNVNLAETSISGISSGAFMAVQWHAAYADSVVGIGVFAGGPYQCAAGGVYQALNVCMAGHANADQSYQALMKAAEAGNVADPALMRDDRVWLYSGYNDGVVKQGTMDALDAYYRRLVAPGNVYYKDNQDAGHAQITQHFGQDCAVTGGDFINDCDLDGAGLLLQHIYGTLNPKQDTNSTDEDGLSGRIIEFSQHDYLASYDVSLSSMAETGYAYMPAVCEQESCRLHIALHGCLQYAERIGDDFYRHAGYNAWADTNHLVVLYPQTEASDLSPMNPKGCWDWWGYTGHQFASRQGLQMAAIWAMAERLAAEPDQADSTAQMTASQATVPAATATSVELVAANSSDDETSFHWRNDPQQHYQLSRAQTADGPYHTITPAPIKGGSYADSGLAPETSYFYRLNVVGQSDYSQTRISTGPAAPACDPYFGSTAEHVAGMRATVAWGWTYALGSGDSLGIYSLSNDVNLIRTKPLFYQEAVCPSNGAR